MLCEKWKIRDYTVLFKDSIYVSDNLHSKTNWASGILLEKYSDQARKVSNFRISNLKSLPFVSFEIDNMDLIQANRIFFSKFEISPQVQDFVEVYLDSVLPDNFYSVHIRGTDKYLEAPEIEDEKIIDCLRRLIDLNQDFEFSIFLASDEKSIITNLRDLVQSAFPKSSIFHLSDFSRSVNGLPLHLDKNSSLIDRQKHTVEALIECMILSKSTVLIKNASFFSGWASVLNPKLKVVMLNAPYEANDWFPDKYIRANQFLIEKLD